jgi:hypothetical protein
MMQVQFLCDLCPAENDEQRQWEKVQLDKEAKQEKKDNLKNKSDKYIQG